MHCNLSRKLLKYTIHVKSPKRSCIAIHVFQSLYFFCLQALSRSDTSTTIEVTQVLLEVKYLDLILAKVIFSSVKMLKYSHGLFILFILSDLLFFQNIRLILTFNDLERDIC